MATVKTADDYLDEARQGCPNGCANVTRDWACQRCRQKAQFAADKVNEAQGTTDPNPHLRRMTED